MKIGISAEIPAFAGMENFIFLISNFFHSDVNRNLPRRRPIFTAEFPPPRRHSRERGNPFLPTNPRIHLVFHKKNTQKFQT